VSLTCTVYLCAAVCLTGRKFTLYQSIRLYRKFTASRIFNGHRFLDEGRVLVTDEKGKVLDTVLVADAGEDIEFFNGILTPGFINVHCHVELSHLKEAIPPETGLVEFVSQVIKKREAGAEEKNEAMQKAVEEMEENGIVAVGDICNTADSWMVKRNSRLQWHNFIELTGFVDEAAEKKLEQGLRLRDHFIKALHGQGATLSPHAPYSVSKKLFELINENSSGQLITIHNQESAEENKLYRNKTGGFLSLYADLGIGIQSFSSTGRSSLQSWLPHFSKQQQLILVHNTFIDENDLAFITSNLKSSTPAHPAGGINPFFCLCPNANRYIEDHLPPASLLRKHRVQIVLGTDSYASNHQLSILEEIRTLVNAKAAHLEETLCWATCNGAIALGMEDQLGTFEKGKKPGVVLIDETDGSSLSPYSKAKKLL